MAQEAKHFSIGDVLDRLSDKLISRHPHVFGDVTAETSAEVLRNWEALKAEEKKSRLRARGNRSEQPSGPEPVLAGVSSAMPALLEAHKLEFSCGTRGLRLAGNRRSLRKAVGRKRELQEELKRLPLPPTPSGQGVAGPGKLKVPEQLRQRLEEEVGDLFFVLVNIARYLSLDSESALKKTNRKFRRRFQWMEEQLRASGLSLQAQAWSNSSHCGRKLNSMN